MSKESARTLRLWKLFRLKPWEDDLILKYQSEHPIFRVLLGNRNAVDHDHRTGKVRGKLDWLINRAYGMIERTAPNNVSEVLMALAVYHDRNPADLALGKKTYGLTGQAKIKQKMVYGSETGETTCTARPRKKRTAPKRKSKKR